MYRCTGPAFTTTNRALTASFTAAKPSTIRATSSLNASALPRKKSGCTWTLCTTPDADSSPCKNARCSGSSASPQPDPRRRKPVPIQKTVLVMERIAVPDPELAGKHARIAPNHRAASAQISFTHELYRPETAPQGPVSATPDAIRPPHPRLNPPPPITPAKRETPPERQARPATAPANHQTKPWQAPITALDAYPPFRYAFPSRSGFRPRSIVRLLPHPLWPIT